MTKAAAAPDFRHVETWVFDLDNTLYPSECDLFALVDARMTRFIAERFNVPPETARAMQKRYYAEDGTTLKGLMTRHGVEPRAFLDFVHDIELDALEPCATLRANLAALPGRRLVFTNGSRDHAERVVEKRGLAGLFEDVFDIEAAGFEPKPGRAAYDRLLARFGLEPARAAMFEDLPRNLAAPAEMGFTSVLVRTGKDWSHEPEGARPAAHGEEPAHVHHVTDDLAAFLGSVRTKSA